MASHWYAERPARRSRQILVDGAALTGLLLCVWIGGAVHDLTAELAAPGRTLESAGADLADRMDDAGAAAGEVPLAGDELATPFDGAGEASDAIRDAGVQQQQVVATLAKALGWITGGLPALLIGVLWLPPRIRSARRARQADGLRETGAGLDMLALRALARQPVAALARAGPELMEGWRARDEAAIAALADLELRRLGLLTPLTVTSPDGGPAAPSPASPRSRGRTPTTPP